MKIELPENLKRETRTFMDALIEKLERSNALESCDCGSLYMLANSYDCYIMASEIVRNEGLTIKGNRGAYVEHPVASLQNKYCTLVLALMKDIGATLKSREKIKALAPEEVEEPEPIDQFL